MKTKLYSMAMPLHSVVGFPKFTTHGEQNTVRFVVVLNAACTLCVFLCITFLGLYFVAFE